jgi:hypothetical protein
MGKKSGPPAPDYTGAANAQAAASQENLTQQTWANRPDQTSPFGNVTWGSSKTIDPATGQEVTKWTQNTSLDPTLQNALNSQLSLQQGRSDLANQQLGQLQQTYSTPMDWSGFAPLAGNVSGQYTNATTGNNGLQFGPQRINTQLQGQPQLNAQAGQGQGQIQSGLDFGGTQNVSDAADTRARAEQAAYGSLTSRLDPQFANQQSGLESDLANRGITRDSAAYTRAMDDFNRSKNDAYSQASLNAINVGGTEAQRDYGMDLGLRQQQVNELGQQGSFANAAQQQGFGQNLQSIGQNNAALAQQFGLGQSAQQQQLAAQQALYQQQLGTAGFGLQKQQQSFGQNLQSNNQNFGQQMQLAGYQNQLRQQQIAEALQQRGQSLNEANALLSGQQVSSPQFANFAQAGQSQTPDLLGAAQAGYGAQLGQQANSNANTAQTIGTAASLAALFFSDRRLKQIIRRVGTHPRGFGVYVMRYIGEASPRVGVIAQEVRRFMPEAVHVNSGVLMVDYAAL